MNYDTYTRKPFEIEAVQITEDNIDDIAELIGEIRGKTSEGVVSQYILIDRRVVPFMRKAFVGWWLTRFDDAFRVYADDVFTEQFEQTDSMAGSNSRMYISLTSGVIGQD